MQSSQVFSYPSSPEVVWKDLSLLPLSSTNNRVFVKISNGNNNCWSLQQKMGRRIMAVASAAFSLDLVRGRELSIDSTSQKTVRSTCSVTKAPFKIAFNARFVSLLAFPTLQRNAVHSVGGISSQFLVEIIDLQDDLHSKLSLHFSTLYQPHGSSCHSPFVFLSGFLVGRWIVAKH